jgi:hypothetical protein
LRTTDKRSNSLKKARNILRRIAARPLQQYYGSIPYFLTFRDSPMLAKRTVKNQITLPKAIATQFPDVEYFEVRTENQRIILEPLRRGQADAVRKKLAALKITESDISSAVKWARKKKS